MIEPIPLSENARDPAIAAEEARHCRESLPGFARWAAGYGPIRHADLTQWRIYRAVDRLARAGIRGDGCDPWQLLHAADRVTCAGMWLAAHQVYARRVWTDGRDLGVRRLQGGSTGAPRRRTQHGRRLHGISGRQRSHG